MSSIKKHENLFVYYFLRLLKNRFFSGLSVNWLSIIIFTAFLFCYPGKALQAQKNGQNYTLHRVTEGQTFKSVARLYNVSPVLLAEYNNLDYYEGALLSKTLNIPKKRVDNNTRKNAPGTVERMTITKQAAKTTAQPVKLKVIEKPVAKVTAVVPDRKVAPVFVRPKVVEKSVAKAATVAVKPTAAEKQIISSEAFGAREKPKKAITIKNAEIRPNAPGFYEKETEDLKLSLDVSNNRVTAFPKEGKSSKQKSFPLREMMPALIFLMSSIILLVVAIFFYRSMNK